MRFPVAQLQQNQLENIRQLEQELGVVLIAYTNEHGSIEKEPEQIKQQRELDYF